MIDCDVHQNFTSVQELMPWIDPSFRTYIERGGYDGFSLPTYPWIHAQGFMRDDAYPEAGGVPGSDYDLLCEQLLDRFDVEYAVLNGEEILLACGLPHAQLARALTSAYNRWVAEVWLGRDARLKASMVVATQDPDGAGEDIRSFGAHPDVVQVLLPGAATHAYGHPRYDPIFRAAAELGLPVAIHPGGEGIGINAAPTATGYPTYYLEWHTLLATTVMSHLVGLVAHGVFERYRELKVVAIEGGVAWLPGLLWRFDADWKALRSEVPWVKRAPTEILHEQLRLTTQPLEQPARVQQLRQALESFPALRDMLLFSSDYPHWDFESPEQVGRRLPVGWRDAVLAENARALYALPARGPDAEEEQLPALAG